MRVTIGTFEQWAGEDDLRETLLDYAKDFEYDVTHEWPCCVECRTPMHPDDRVCDKCKWLDEEARRSANNRAIG